MASKESKGREYRSLDRNVRFPVDVANISVSASVCVIDELGHKVSPQH